jgi:Raf kinase inhibitor-like YbhB/YbcL family protein
MSVRLICAGLACALLPLSAAAQDKQPAAVQIVGHVLKPKKLEPTKDQIAKLKVPDGFKLEVFADGLLDPRALAVGDDGTLYATRRNVGDVVMLKDEDGDGKAEVVKTVASRPDMHGIAIDGKKVYLVTIKELYVADIKDDGTFGDLKLLLDDLPDAGQHPDRTIAMGPDGMLYLSVGSTCNACDERNPENATMLQVKPDGSARKIFASGLRNTIGFAFEPGTGALYGMDHGIDWLGDDEQPEELNLIEHGKKYGWPYIYGKGGKNPQDEPPGDITLDEWAAASEEPVLTTIAHSAPMQMAFYTGTQFPEEYRGDAFLALHGSWNRKPPSGYEVFRITFEDGKPTGFEPFISGFLQQTGKGSYGFIGRPFGVAMAKDGSLFIGDDANGVIYRVSHEAKTAQAGSDTSTGAAAEEPVMSEQKTPEELAAEILKAEGNETLEITSPAFKTGDRLDLRYSAYGQNISPALAWAKGPENTKSYVILMEDPDAASPKPVVHWILYNVPPDVTELREGIPGSAALSLPKSAMQGTNSHGSVGYFGPRPPAGGDHHYHFQLFALDTTLDLKPGASRKDMLEAMEGHVLAEGEIVGLFKKPEKKPEDS